MSKITIAASNGALTLSPADLKLSRNNLTTVEFQNDAGEDVTVAFSSGSPFTVSSQSIQSGKSWSPVWASNVTATSYDYGVSGGSNSGATGDIDIQTTPLP